MNTTFATGPDEYNGVPSLGTVEPALSAKNEQGGSFQVGTRIDYQTDQIATKPDVPTIAALELLDPRRDVLDAIGCGRWWVLHTKPRCEKALACDLQRLSIAHYLPVIRAKRTYGRRTTSVELPLFPGYLFMRGGNEERYAALRTDRIANVITVDDQERLRTDLRHIERVVASDFPVDLYRGLRIGRRCRVIAGPLRDVEGVVVRRRNSSRVYIEAAVIGQSAVVEIDSALLEPID